MNNEMIKFARRTLKKNLKVCTYNQRELFRRMYANHLPVGSTVFKVVMAMDVNKLDFAMQQVQRTIDKNKIKGIGK